jgi:hypothetical protein
MGYSSLRKKSSGRYIGFAEVHQLHVRLKGYAYRDDILTANNLAKKMFAATNGLAFQL